VLAAGLPQGIHGGFTTRFGGVSGPPWEGRNLALHVGDDPDDVLANRAVVAEWFGSSAIAYPEQVHGRGVVVVDGEVGVGEWPGGRGCDAVVTRCPRVPVGVLVADCMPILIADPEAGVVAAAHAGRRGLAGGVVQAALEAMAGLGAEPARMAAVIGPAICGRCYEVPAAMQAEVAAAVPGTACTTASGSAGLDLPAGALGLLRAAGVAARSTGICTAEDERFYSYRRDGLTGRFAGVVMLSPDG
jgi:YfiH family protein